MAEPALLPITCPRCSFVAEFKMTNRQASPVLQPYTSEYFQRRCVVEKAEQGFSEPTSCLHLMDAVRQMIAAFRR